MKIAFIGAGAMCTAIALGLSKTGIFEGFIFTDPDAAKLEVIKAQVPNSEVSTCNDKVAEADVIVIAVKPQVSKKVMNRIGHLLTEKHLIISIMAGVTMGQIRSETKSRARIIRTMPNTPLLALLGSVAYCTDVSATEEDAKLAHKMFSAMGYCVRIDEKQMDLIPGVAGSSPAFVAIFIDALADGGVQCGLPRDLALRLAANAVYGSGGMIAKGLVAHPCLLRDQVCSPGGSSIVGVSALEAGGFRAAVIDAVIKTTERTRELSKI